jgi:hypothetical protein
MKKLITLNIITLLFGISNVKSQDCTFYFPQKPGTVMIINHYKTNDKFSGTTKTKIIEATGSSIKFSSEYINDQGKSLNSGEYEVKCKNGEFAMDMSSLTNKMNLSAFKNMKTDIQYDEITLPSDLQPGEQLNNGEVRINISNNGMTIMKTTIKITNRKVVDIENITTPAGTFQCAKITYDVETQSLVTTHSKGVEFISKQAGVVRSESYDSKDKLQSYSVLNSVAD